MGYIISKRPQPKEWLGEHYLACRHSLGRYSIDYLMYCNILKEMPAGRFKVRVFGSRWTTTDGERIRYVERYQVLSSADFKD